MDEILEFKVFLALKRTKEHEPYNLGSGVKRRGGQVPSSAGNAKILEKSRVFVRLGRGFFGERKPLFCVLTSTLTSNIIGLKKIYGNY